MILVPKMYFCLSVLVKYAESSTDSSDYEPLATKRKKKAKEQKSSASIKNRKSRLTGKSLKGKQHVRV